MKEHAVGYYEGDPNDHEVEYLVASLFQGGRVYLYLSKNVIRSFQNRRRGNPSWLPLMAIPIERDRFCDIAGLPKLPTWVTVEWMAVNMRSAPIVHECKSAVLSHIAVMPSDARTALFHDWLVALESTTPSPPRLKAPEPQPSWMAEMYN
jgi:hypothetical protein